MRIIIPLILVALMLPCATSSDQPTGEWLVPPDAKMGVVLASANAAEEPSTRDCTRPHRPLAATQPARRDRAFRFAARACVRAWRPSADAVQQKVNRFNSARPTTGPACN